MPHTQSGQPTLRSGLLVLSPHLDDAVFGCGHWLARSPNAIVVTVFAGRPEKGMPLTDWDRESGFRPGTDVIGVRRIEDRNALDMLNAKPVWLEFLDSQYAESPRSQAIADAVNTVLTLAASGTILFPLGLFHSDHRLTADAALLLAKRHPAKRWLMYEDALYRQVPGLVDERLNTLQEKGWRVQSLPFVTDTDAVQQKRKAVACYSSQLLALCTPGRPGVSDIHRDEAYWSLLSATDYR